MKKQIWFSYDPDFSIEGALVVKTDYGLPIHFCIEKGEITHFYLFHHEIELPHDDTDELFVRIQFELYSLTEVINQANAQLDGILDDVELEEREAKADADFLSSPSKTGRI